MFTSYFLAYLRQFFNYISFSVFKYFFSEQIYSQIYDLASHSVNTQTNASCPEMEGKV